MLLRAAWRFAAFWRVGDQAFAHPALTMTSKYLRHSSVSSAGRSRMKRKNVRGRRCRTSSSRTRASSRAHRGNSNIVFFPGAMTIAPASKGHMREAYFPEAKQLNLYVERAASSLSTAACSACCRAHRALCISCVCKVVI